MRDIARTVMGISEGDEPVDNPKAKKSLLGKLALKSMLSKKPKDAKVAAGAPA